MLNSILEYSYKNLLKVLYKNVLARDKTYVCRQTELGKIKSFVNVTNVTSFTQSFSIYILIV